jgi:hypothetical protein
MIQKYTVLLYDIIDLGELSYYSDQAVEWMTRIPFMGRVGIFSLLMCPDWPWEPLTLLVNGHQGFLP